MTSDRPLTAAAEQRFEQLVIKDGPIPVHQPSLGPCWSWSKKAYKNGYIYFTTSRTERWLAHRYSYRLHVGPIPGGLHVDHLCRNRTCTNPTHLEPVTPLENLQRGAGYGLKNGMRTVCRNGHKYTPENTYITPGGEVRCRECARVRDRTPERLARKRKRST